MINDDTDLSLPPFSDVYRDHLDDVFRYCRARLGSLEAAEDVTAQTFTAALEAYERTQPDATAIRPWLFRIAHNACVDHHRRSQRVHRLWSRLADGRRTSETIEEAAVIREDVRRMMALMSRLGVRDRSLIALRCGADLSFAEIASVLGINQNAATVATHRALNRLRKLVAKEWSDD